MSRNGVITALMKGMAAAEPLHAHPHATQHSMPGNGFHHVHRTRRIVAAGRRQKRRNKQFVTLQNANQDSLHRANIRPISRRRSSKGASRTLRLGLKTMDQFSGEAWSSLPTASLIRRLMRFRRTALPSARGTVNPKREDTTPHLLCKQKAAK